jgi:hypothetical protein
MADPTVGYASYYIKLTIVVSINHDLVGNSQSYKGR